MFRIAQEYKKHSFTGQLVRPGELYEEVEEVEKEAEIVKEEEEKVGKRKKPIE